MRLPDAKVTVVDASVTVHVRAPAPATRRNSPSLSRRNGCSVAMSPIQTAVTSTAPTIDRMVTPSSLQIAEAWAEFCPPRVQLIVKKSPRSKARTLKSVLKLMTGRTFASRARRFQT